MACRKSYGGSFDTLQADNFLVIREKPRSFVFCIRTKHALVCAMKSVRPCFVVHGAYSQIRSVQYQSPWHPKRLVAEISRNA